MSNFRGPIVDGFDSNFFKKVTISVTTFGANNDGYGADVVFNIRGQQSFSMINEGSTVVEYSFNGSALHGDMTPGFPSEALTFDNRRVSKIWFRCPSGGSSIIRVEAWAQV